MRRGRSCRRLLSEGAVGHAAHFIEQQAEPLVPFLSKYMPVQASDQIQLIAKWKVLIDDFQQYANKGTSSTLASLEDFITTGIDKIPAAACQTGAPEGGAMADALRRAGLVTEQPGSGRDQGPGRRR